MKKGKTIVLVAVLTIASIIVIISSFFNMSSNVSFVFKQQTDLMVKQDMHWIQPQKIKNSNGLLSIIYEADGVRVSQITLRRKGRTGIQKIWEFVMPPKVMIFEFSPNHSFRLIAETKESLKHMNTTEAINKNEGLNFVVNASFYKKDQSIIGELIVRGQSVSKDNGFSSGFFKVVDEKPRVGPRSLFKNMPGRVSYSCQAHPSVIRDGQIFHYIISGDPPYHKLWKRKTYRNLIGEKENGNIIFVLSNRGALLSVKEITIIGSLLDIYNASLFDGGAALQYAFEHKNQRITFSAFNNSIEIRGRLGKYLHQLTGIKTKQKSPVYLGVIVKD